jgi:hypothetical protein
MTPEFRPYLLETDLRTAEDVLQWIEYRRRYGRATIDHIADDLVEQIDRERRQACRRGALEKFKAFARTCTRFKRGVKVPDLGRGRATEDCIWRHTHGCSEELQWLAAALSFRAAARAK